jgi:hypothetical protein
MQKEIRRTIMQIACESNRVGSGIYALCSDGTVWAYYPAGLEAWTLLPQIPQGRIGIDVLPKEDSRQ